MKALKQINLNNIIFIDIETVRSQNELIDNSPVLESWEYKMRYSKENSDKFDDHLNLKDLYKQKAALYAEFGKIVCITIGKIQDEKLKIKSYYGNNEKELLQEFCTIIEGLVAVNPKIQLCGHAIKGFDIPFIMRRCLVNRIAIPDLFDVADTKPWLLTCLDTLELWKGTGFYSASLLNIAVVLGLPSPKQDMEGSETSTIYYEEGDIGLNKIVKYCEGDVLTVCNIVRAIRQEDPLESEIAQLNTEKALLLEKIYNTKKITIKEMRVIESVLSTMDEDEQKIANQILSITLPK